MVRILLIGRGASGSWDSWENDEEAANSSSKVSSSLMVKRDLLLLPGIDCFSDQIYHKPFKYASWRTRFFANTSISWPKQPVPASPVSSQRTLSHWFNVFEPKILESSWARFCSFSPYLLLDPICGNSRRNKCFPVWMGKGFFRWLSHEVNILSGE